MSAIPLNNGNGDTVKIGVEICVDSPSIDTVTASVTASYRGGASTVELCGSMDLGGLSPSCEAVLAARNAFGNRKGLVVMVRPRDGDFVFDDTEIEQMKREIDIAAASGADGVAIGMLRSPDNRVDTAALKRIADKCSAYGLAMTFHRAFDATPDPRETLDICIDHGVSRILTSGLPWKSPGTALDGTAGIAATIRHARGRVEVVIGGGVSSLIAPGILASIPLDIGPVSLHAYSSVLVENRADLNAIRTLVSLSEQYSE